MNISLLSMQKTHKQNITCSVKKIWKFQFLSTEKKKKQPKKSHTKKSARDGVLRLTLFVSINGDYTVTFTSAALVSPFLIIMRDLVGFVADTLLLRGQLAEKWIH